MAADRGSRGHSNSIFHMGLLYLEHIATYSLGRRRILCCGMYEIGVQAI